jgi:UDP-N-acetylglucosamine acyltransferase
MIHPTAIIDPAARLAEGVRVGPYVVIEGPAEIGAGCVLEAHATLVGEVKLGPHNRVGHGAVLGGWPQDLAFDFEQTRSGVEIGEGNVIREHVTIHRGTAAGSVTRVGDRCLLMAGSHVGHNVRLGNGCILANNVLLGGYVEVGDRAFLGGGSVFHQHVRVGRGVIVQGVSGFSKDVPPFTLAAKINTVAGLNVVGLRRGGFSPAERAELKRAFVLVYQSGLNISQALERAKTREWTSPAAREFFEFVAAAKKRGLCALLRQARSGGGEK